MLGRLIARLWNHIRFSEVNQAEDELHRARRELVEGRIAFRKIDPKLNSIKRKDREKRLDYKLLEDDYVEASLSPLKNAVRHAVVRLAHARNANH